MGLIKYIVGGDFVNILKLWVTLDESITKIYIAELLISIDYLHGLDIIHRDLKPDNMLLGVRHKRLTIIYLYRSRITEILRL